MSTLRNDNRYVEDAGVSFAIYCDENGLDDADAERLADQVYDWLCQTVADRQEAQR